MNQEILTKLKFEEGKIKQKLDLINDSCRKIRNQIICLEQSKKQILKDLNSNKPALFELQCLELNSVDVVLDRNYRELFLAEKKQKQMYNEKKIIEENLLKHTKKIRRERKIKEIAVELIDNEDLTSNFFSKSAII